MPTPQFSNFIRDLQNINQAQGVAAAAPGVARTSWAIPSSFTSGLDVQSPLAWTAACDRSTLNTYCVNQYRTGATPNAGRIGNVMAAKQAIDRMATFERAMQARYASGIRCRTWAGARRQGHGDNYYGVHSAMLNSVNSLLAAASEPNQPGTTV